METTCNGLTLKQWIEKETKPQTVILWETEQEFTPFLLKRKFGDSQQLITIQSLNQRLCYWLVLIDSKTDILSDEFSDEQREDIVNAIEDEFGRAMQDDSSLDDDDEYESAEEWNEENFEYPMIDWNGGFWGLVVNMVTQEIGE
jgi:hypothetical protein